MLIQVKYIININHTINLSGFYIESYILFSIIIIYN